MDTQPSEVDAVKEMEEAPEIPTDHDQGRFQPSRCPSNLGQNGSMAISDEATSTVCHEPGMVQTKRVSLSERLYNRFLSNLKVRSLIEERYTWPVRAVLLGGGNLWVTSYQMAQRGSAGQFGVPLHRGLNCRVDA